MIGNIAHQWRQPLSAISSTATGMDLQVQLGLASDVEVSTAFSNITNYTQVLTKIIEDFRGYLANDEETKEFDMYENLLKTINIVDASFKNNHISIDIKNGGYSTHCFGFPNQFSQAVLNILNNAQDALVANKEESDRRIYLDILENETYNIVKILDNAGGIPTDILGKVFDPYFTTKHQSQGTGIGLYVSKNIIEKNMKGELLVKNIELKIDAIDYKGACFEIAVPKFNQSGVQKGNG
jgi:signal transduction histidine kinase